MNRVGRCECYKERTARRYRVGERRGIASHDLERSNALPSAKNEREK